MRSDEYAMTKTLLTPQTATQNLKVYRAVNRLRIALIKAEQTAQIEC